MKWFHDDFPVSPRRFPFFYGWVIVAASVLGTLSSIPGQTMGVSVFTDHLLDALGLSRTQLSLAYMAGTICSGMFMLQGGKWLDRFGVRPMMAGSAVCLGASLLFMASVGEIAAAFHRFFGDALAVASAMVVAFVGFFFIRFFGQGLIAMIPRVMLGRWFERRRGLAVGVVGLFTAFGFSISPLLLNALIEWSGWQGAYLILAAVIGIGTSLMAWAFFRERPEDTGLVRDGYRPGEDSADSAPKLDVAHEYTLSEARRTSVFWIYGLALASHGLVVTAVTFHIVSLSENAGLVAEQGLQLFLPMAVVTVAVNFSGGWISDKIRLKYLLLVMMAGQAAGSAGLLFLGSFGGRVMVVAGYGVSGGLFLTLIGVTWPRFFGLTHLGAISGFHMAIMVFASSLGPILFGGLFEQTGSYAPGILVSMALAAALFISAFWGDNPQWKERGGQQDTF